MSASAADAGGTRAVDLSEYLAILRRRKWTIAAVFVAVVAAAAIFTFRQTPLYTAQARVLIGELPAPGGTETEEAINASTEKELLASIPVADRVRDDLSLAVTPEDLLGGVDAQVLEDTEVLVASFTSADPDLAQQVVNSFADNYLVYRSERALRSLEQVADTIEERITDVRAELTELTGRLQDAGAAERFTLETERSVLASRLGALQARLDEVQPEELGTRTAGEVIEPARRPSVPSSPNKTRNFALAGGLGLILGIGAALLRERLDPRFASRADVEGGLGAPVLATIPAYSRVNAETPSLILVHKPRAPAAEAYRTLRTNLTFVMEREGIKTFAVTSPSSSEGKTLTVANLGAAFAYAGSRVVVVSGDLRRPQLERLFGISPNRGLSSWLSRQDGAVSSLLFHTGIRSLAILPSGPVPPNPAELLQMGRLRPAFEQLENDFDIVIVDSPPILPVADAALIAAAAGGTLLVIDASKTRRQAAAHAQRELERVSANLVGVVQNALSRPQADSYASYY